MFTVGESNVIQSSGNCYNDGIKPADAETYMYLRLLLGLHFTVN